MGAGLTPPALAATTPVITTRIVLFPAGAAPVIARLDLAGSRNVITPAATTPPLAIVSRFRLARGDTGERRRPSTYGQQAPSGHLGKSSPRQRLNVIENGRTLNHVCLLLGRAECYGVGLLEAICYERYRPPRSATSLRGGTALQKGPSSRSVI